MNIKGLIFLFLFGFTGLLGFTQSLSKIKKVWEKGDNDKALTLIQKSLSKDSTAFGNHFFLSLYFLDSTRGSDLDSARIWIEEGLRLREKHQAAHLASFQKAELPTNLLDVQYGKVTTAYYQYSLAQANIAQYNTFMKLFPTAPQLDRVLFLRDSLAYAAAEEQDLWQSFKSFMDQYPTSVFYGQAKKNYELRLFKEMTGSGNLEDYIRFLELYPDTPFRQQVQEAIFQQSTFLHIAEDYAAFLRRYPDSKLGKRAGDLLYYLTKQDSAALVRTLKMHPNSDSLRRIYELEQKALLPLIINSKIQFFDQMGSELENLAFEEVPPAYMCSRLLDEWVIGKKNGEWVSQDRAGNTLVSGFRSIQELGGGLMLIELESTKKILHKSGFPILNFPIADAFLVFEKWVAFKKDLLWGIAAFNGEIVVQPTYKSIEQRGKFLVMETNRGFYLSNMEAALQKIIQIERLLVDDFELLSDTLVLGFKGDRETLIDHKLTSALPIENYKIYWHPAFCYVKRPNGISQRFNPTTGALDPQPFLYIYENENWQVLQEGLKWRVNLKRLSQSLVGIDSLTRLSEHHLLLKRRDTVSVLFPNGHQLTLSKEQVSLMTSRNEGEQAPLLILADPKLKKVFDVAGTLLFEGNYDAIHYLNDSTFVVKTKGKEGVIDAKKVVILRPEYDLIEGRGGMIVLLKKNQIGCLDLRKNTFIPSLYEGRVERFGDHYRVTKLGKTGLISGKNKVVCPISYDDLLVWNDTSFWARSGASWSLLSTTGSPIIQGVVDIRPWETDVALGLHIFIQGSKYGIIHPTKGEVIPPQYNDIINVGTANKPIFFAEQHLETADFFVVTYFDQLGNIFKSHAFRSEEYSKIYCDPESESAILVR